MRLVTAASCAKSGLDLLAEQLEAVLGLLLVLHREGASFAAGSVGPMSTRCQRRRRPAQGGAVKAPSRKSVATADSPRTSAVVVSRLGRKDDVPLWIGHPS